MDRSGDAVAALMAARNGVGFAGFPLSPRAEARLARLELFSEADYFQMHPDVARAGMKAWEHALQHAANEGRPTFLKGAIARAYGPRRARMRREADDLGHRAPRPPWGSRARRPQHGLRELLGAANR